MGCIIPLAYASLGAFTLVTQALLLREFFVVAAGNEVSFGIAMAGWLLGVGGGSLVGAFVSPRLRSTAAAFAGSVLGLCIAAPLLLAAVRLLPVLAGLPRGMPLPLAQSLYLVPLLSLPFCVLSGFAFPLAAGLRPRSTAPAAGAEGLLAGAYAWESFGAMAGGAVYTFLLAGRLSPLAATAWLALPLLALTAAIAQKAGSKRAAASLGLLLLVFLGAGAGGLATGGDSLLTQRRWQALSPARLVAHRDSRYQNLQLGEDHGQYSLYANGQLAAVFPDEEENELLAASLLSQHPRPRRVLVIGDISGGLAKHLLRYGLESLTAVEIDPGFTAMIRDHLGAGDRRALDDPRLRWRAMDGRRYVRLAGRGNGGRREGFDLAFIQQPDAWTAQINRFYTREFFLDLRRILAPDGVVALRLASAENYASEIVTPYTAAICKTLATVFPAIALLPGMTNFIFASGAPASVSQDPVLLARRYRAIAPAPARLSPVFASLYPAEKAAYLRGALTRSPIPSLNSDDRPIAYFLGSRLLGWSTGSPLTGLFAWFAGLRAPRVFLALGLLFLPGLLWILWRRGRPSPFPALLAAACGGFAGLSFEVTAIFIFQSAWGFAYGAVGMLIALFMLGLGAGAVLASKWAAAARPGPAESAKVMAGIMLLVSASAVASLFLFPAAAAGRAGQVLLAAWLGWTGLLCGTILPLGLRALARHPAGRAAGWLNAGDYLGGAAGSVLMAAFFLPLLGTRNSLALLALAALAAAAALAIAARTATGERRP